MHLPAPLRIMLSLAFSLIFVTASADEPPFEAEWIGLAGANMPEPTYWSAMEVYDGRLYVIGGLTFVPEEGDITDCHYVQIYDPPTDTWTYGAPKPTACRLAAATAIGDTIYVSGGRDDIGPLYTHETYHVPTNTWSTVKRLPLVCRGHACVPYGGKIYLFGGNTGNYQKWVKIYDPIADAWGTGVNMPIQAAYGGAAYAPGVERIFYAGGTDRDTFHSASYRYDPGENAWDQDPSPLVGPTELFGELHYSETTGLVYILSGQTLDSDTNNSVGTPFNQVLDPDTNEWSPAPSFPSPLARFGVAGGEIDGRIYAAGGYDGQGICGLLDWVDPLVGVFYEPNPRSPERRQSPVVVALHNRVYSVGGWSDTAQTATGTVYVFDPAEGTWSQGETDDPQPRYRGAGAVWQDKILITGGIDDTADPAGRVNAATSLFHPDSGSWTDLPPDPVARFDAGAAVLSDRLYVLGGEDPDGNLLSSISILDLEAGLWSEGPSLPAAFARAAVIAAGSKIYILSGYDGIAGDFCLDEPILYHPATGSFQFGAEIPVRVRSAAPAAWGEYLVLDGGVTYYWDENDWRYYRRGSDVTQFYHYSSGAWYTVHRPWNRVDHGLAVIGDEAYAVMGSDHAYLADRLDHLRLTRPCRLYCNPMATPSVGPAPLPVAFQSNLSIYDCSGGINVRWVFGDGNDSVDQDPFHTYQQPGTYMWSFSAQVEGETCSDRGTIEVTDDCVLDCTIGADPAGGVAPLSVQFTADVTMANCSGGTLVSWEFGDGCRSYEEDPVHVYDEAGVFTFSFTASADGESCQQTGELTVEPRPCRVACAAEVPSEGRTHQEIDFYASVETEDCVEDPEVRWAFGDGATSSGTIAQHEYQGTGSFDWSLVATADDAACTQAGTIFIEWGLPGDGDGDGAVSIGEVQQVVNMFLGTMPAGNGADCDGDGSISIGEVQKVINAFLGEPVTC